MDIVNPHEDPRQEHHPDYGHHSVQEMVDHGSQDHAIEVQTKEKTLPAGKSQRLHLKSRAKLLLLYHLVGEESMQSGHPTGIRQDPSRQRAVLDSSAIHSTLGIIHHAST